MNRWFKGVLFLVTALVISKLCWDLSQVYDTLDRDPELVNAAYVLAGCQPILSLMAAYLTYAGLSVLITGKVRRFFA